jgi:PERQ amino acid-rich with GYF domain-containing protein
MPMPFPPPSSTTPLPAPTAQRVRSNLPEQYSRGETDSPDTNASAPAQPPPLAPWAKDIGQESQRGPSLKEIQEAEARKAAKAEEAAAAIRKAAMEQESNLLREREKAAAATAAGLPASSTWAHGSPVSASSPWIKPIPAKVPAPGLPGPSASMSKKTLAEIQLEEELRKQKAKEVAVQSGAPPPPSKSYANLAGRPGLTNASASQLSPPPGAAPGGWATVGAGGKVRIPTGPAAQVRSASVSNIKPAVVPIKPASKPAATNGRSDSNNAMEEFNKWVHWELSRGITGVNDSKSSYEIPIVLNAANFDPLVASFQAALDVLPLDTGVIADAVYANSTTMDGRHFSEEFVRRKRLAEKGIVEKQPLTTETKSTGTSSGWSEVAKKSSSVQVKENDTGVQAAAGFKVVPSRKKGKK